MAHQVNLNKEPELFWPVTFAEVEEAQLKTWLTMTPGQRLAMAEELLEFVRLVQQARTERVDETRTTSVTPPDPDESEGLTPLYLANRNF